MDEDKREKIITILKETNDTKLISKIHDYINGYMKIKNKSQ